MSSSISGVLTRVERRRPSARALQSMMFLIAIVVAMCAVLPALWVILSSLEPTSEFYASVPPLVPTHFIWSTIGQAWNSFDFPVLYLNSFYYLAGALCTSLLFNGLLGYVLSRLRPRGSRLVLVVVLWSLLVPNVVSVVATYQNIVHFPILGANLENSFYALWIMAGGNAFYVLIFKSFFDRIDDSYLEAARIDGASDLQMFRRIILPMSKPVFVTVAILTSTYVWADFFWPYLILNDSHDSTTMVGIFAGSTQGVSENLVLGALLLGMLPPLVLFIALQRYIIQGFQLGGIKG